MEKVTHVRIIGIDVRGDWSDIHRLPDDQRDRIPNADDGHIAVPERTRKYVAVVCFWMPRIAALV